MKTLEERTRIIRKMINIRMRTNPSVMFDIPASEIDLLPSLAIWGTPEGTIFNIIDQYLFESKKGVSEAEIIINIECRYESFVKTPLPHNIMDYIKLKISQDHNLFDHLYDDIFIRSCFDLINREMEYSKISNVKENKKEGCYIATACYGDINSTEVIIFRRFRDEVLYKNLFGRVFIKIYYLLFPFISNYLKMNQSLNARIKKNILDKIYKKLVKRFENLS